MCHAHTFWAENIYWSDLFRWNSKEWNNSNSCITGTFFFFKPQYLLLKLVIISKSWLRWWFNMKQMTTSVQPRYLLHRIPSKLHLFFFFLYTVSLDTRLTTLYINKLEENGATEAVLRLHLHTEGVFHHSWSSPWSFPVKPDSFNVPTGLQMATMASPCATWLIVNHVQSLVGCFADPEIHLSFPETSIKQKCHRVKKWD